MSKIENIAYETRIVAFVDILGFKKIIFDSESNPSKLKAIYEALEFFKTREKSEEWNLQLIEIEESAQYKGVANFDIAKKLLCTCFSDTIVISVKTTGSDINEVTSTLITNLAFIGAKLMTEGILFRGAITVGNLIHSEKGIIMGQALIDAYELESNIANNPRIILSKDLVAKLNYPLLTKRERYPYHQYLKEFEDNYVGFHQMVYFEVLQSWIEMNEEKLRLELSKIKKTIVDGLNSHKEHPRINAKYKWLKAEYEKLIIFSEKAKEIL